MQTIRVMVVDDHEMVAEGLVHALSSDPAIEVVGRAGSVGTALRLARRVHPDVVLMDYQLPDGDGVAATRDLRASQPDIQVVMVTASDHPTVIRAAIDAGCSGFVPKDRAARDVVGAVRAIARGDVVLPAGAVTSGASTGSPGGSAGLTPREVEVLQLLADGLSTAAVAETCFLSVSTVRNHVQRILNKLGVHSKLEAVSVGLREGFVRPPD